MPAPQSPMDPGIDLPPAAGVQDQRPALLNQCGEVLGPNGLRTRHGGRRRTFVVGVQNIIRCNTGIGILVGMIAHTRQPQSVAHAGDLCAVDRMSGLVEAPHRERRPKPAGFGCVQLRLLDVARERLRGGKRGVDCPVVPAAVVGVECKRPLQRPNGVTVSLKKEQRDAHLKIPSEYRGIARVKPD